jgi:glucose/arabinose dehydrogenase
MQKWIPRIVGFLLFVAIAGWLLLPDGYVINGPLLDRMLGREIAAATQEIAQLRLKAPEGYEVTLFAEGIEDARLLRVSPDGSLIVSQTRVGQILHVLGDADQDGFSDGHRVLVDGLDRPHGIDFHDGHLFIGEGSAIARIAYQENGPDSITVTGDLERIITGLPSGGNHWRHTLRFGPDDGLYVTVGSTCNVCEEEDPRRAALLRYEADGSNETIFARGLRNTVSFDWRPGTNDLYGTDNGRDLIGDDYPACELNLIEAGGFYGWPYANASASRTTDPDPDFGAGHEAEIAQTLAPAHSFRAHNAPLGITFVRSSSADTKYKGAALVALHGSWNRSELDGYAVVSLHWDAAGKITEHPFLTGFEQDGDVIGRPVDIAEGRDGAFYVSDDYGSAIYRVGVAGSSPRSALRAHRIEDRAPQFSAEDRLAGFDEATRANMRARGEALYAENACATCHLGGAATPGVARKRLEGLADRYSIERLEAFFLAPQPPMPIFDLPENDRRALAIYLMETYAE